MKDFRTFAAAMGSLVIVGVAIMIAVSMGQDRDGVPNPEHACPTDEVFDVSWTCRKPADATADAARAEAYWVGETPVPPSAWEVYITEILRRANILAGDLEALDCDSPETAQEWVDCLEQRIDIRDLADALYVDLERHGVPVPECAKDARNQLAYALDDLRFGYEDLGKIHLQAAAVDLLCKP